MFGKKHEIRYFCRFMLPPFMKCFLRCIWRYTYRPASIRFFTKKMHLKMFWQFSNWIKRRSSYQTTPLEFNEFCNPLTNDSSHLLCSCDFFCFHHLSCFQSIVNLFCWAQCYWLNVQESRCEYETTVRVSIWGLRKQNFLYPGYLIIF